MDERMDDVRAVMDAAGIQRAALWGMSEGGPLAALFAATYPDRCRALVLYGAFARFSSWIPTDEAFAALLQYIDQGWERREFVVCAPLAKTIHLPKLVGRFERLWVGALPAAVPSKSTSAVSRLRSAPTLSSTARCHHQRRRRTLWPRTSRARYVELPGVTTRLDR
jgi:pimeloyl-ACP methyl ester carboxylesterase